MSDSNCDSPSQGECVPITPHPLYNLLNGIRTHTKRILSSFPLPIGIQGVILKLRVRLELTASILQVSHSTIGVIGAFYTRCRQSSINYGHCFKELISWVTSLILDTRVELVFPAWKTGVLTIRRIELIMNIFIFIIFIMYILYHNF